MEKPRILIVDDELDVVEFIERVLATEGFDTISAYDGLSAVDAAVNEGPDLILLDIMMPMMSGYEVMEQLKADPQTKNIPVICLTSAHGMDAQARCKEKGASWVMMKPFSPAELVAQIRIWLAKAQQP